MNCVHYLTAAGVPPHLHAEALASLEGARERAAGLLLHKLKVRLLKASKIAKLLPWEAERLLDVRPDLADWDVAPMLNITAHGDNVPWPSGRPAPGAWLEDTPEARAANYWLAGTHPRSAESRRAWYRRNGGEYRAWRLGHPADPAQPVQVWRGEGVTVRQHNGAWQIVAVRRVLGPLHLRIRVGYEIDNVLREDGTQLWYPIPGHDLRAPVTWSVLPAWGGGL